MREDMVKLEPEALERRMLVEVLLAAPVGSIWVCCRYCFTNFKRDYRDSTKAAVVTITSNDFKLVLFCWHPVIDFWFRFAYTLNFSPAMVTPLIRIFPFTTP